MILLFTCAHCFAYQEVEEDVYDLQSGFCFKCKYCHKDTVVLLATEKDYHVAADAIAVQQSVQPTISRLAQADGESNLPTISG
jgi:hypothetical protein